MRRPSPCRERLGRGPRRRRDAGRSVRPLAGVSRLDRGIPGGIRRIPHHFAVAVWGAVIPPEWATLTEPYLCCIDGRTGIKEPSGIAFAPGFANVSSSRHQVRREPFALAFGQGGIRAAP